MIESPCINICKLNSSGLCDGCFRTLDEIAQWSKLTDEQKTIVLQKITERQDEIFK